MTIRDDLFPFRVSANRYGAHCHVRIIEAGPYTVLILSELASNGGMSVCNTFEDLLPQVAYGLDGEHLVLIEHWGPFSYDDREPTLSRQGREEEFSRVTFTYESDRPSWIANSRLGSFSRPKWRPISRQARVEVLAGGELPAFPFEERPEGFGLAPAPEGGR